MTLYLPPNYFREDNSLVFLAGPITGAPRWQNRAFEFIKKAKPLANIASPRYIGENESQIGDWIPDITSKQQIAWETYHLKKAGSQGVILFWLAKETQQHIGKDYPYAQTSRLELGEWKTRHEIEGAKLVLGIESGFSGEHYIRHRFSKDCPRILITETLEKTCEAALKLI